MTYDRYGEALRLLGYRGRPGDEKTLQLIKEIFDELDRTGSPVYTAAFYGLQLCHSGEVLFSNGWTVYSNALYEHLKTCEKGVVFAATLGADIDRQLKRLSLTDIAMAAVLQACAAVYLEEFCDRVQAALHEEYPLEMSGYFMTDRFSPGYGDFTLSHQKMLLEAAAACKQIGLTCTERYMLTPTKSITAVIGLSKTNICRQANSCEHCNSKTCCYRRETE
ncbi:Vitamin B12 dependent methionine synthase activation subunit [Christensenellaceae bacterium OttesenSCG-928-M15]|nr:Vitamin B12 dependent methionine synthase activation subunit [Christensenellaceae bacterium OttesenSCG-928-M15]